MRSQGNQPNTEQVAFREALRALYPSHVIHHIFGASAKVKIDLVSENIGHWGIIALTIQEHRAIHNHSDRKIAEKSIFKQQMINYFTYYFDMPVPREVLTAIMNWRM